MHPASAPCRWRASRRERGTPPVSLRRLDHLARYCLVIGRGECTRALASKPCQQRARSAAAKRLDRAPQASSSLFIGRNRLHWIAK
jgi:hypothetical protein